MSGPGGGHALVECFLGHHATTVVQPGRTFLRELFSLLHRAKLPYHFIRILWLKCLLHHWSGALVFLPTRHCTLGCVGWLGSWHLCRQCGLVPGALAWKELVAATIWGPQWSGQHICFNSDNMAVVAVLSPFSSERAIEQASHL